MITPLILGFSFYFLANFKQADFPAKNLGQLVLGANDSKSATSTIYASLPKKIASISSSYKTENSNYIIVENYLKRYGSPLLSSSDFLVDSSIKYGVDPFLIVAIAQQESNLGKKTPENCFNAWGWGIHSKGTKCYLNWEEAIESVTSGIAKDYCGKGYCQDVCIMMKKYTPGSNGSWCFGVNQFLEELKTGNY